MSFLSQNPFDGSLMLVYHFKLLKTTCFSAGVVKPPKYFSYEDAFDKSVAVRGPERAGGGAAVATAHMAKGATTSKSGVPLTNTAEAST